MDNNKASVKIGNRVYSLRESTTEYWDNVTATYPDIGGEIQTTFVYGIDGDPSPNVINTGDFFVYDSKIYGMANMYEGHVICPLTAKSSSQTGLPLYFNTYNAPVLYQDEQMTQFVTDYPQPGAYVYCTIDGNPVTLQIPETYSSVTAGSTATTPPAPYDKPLIYNRNLDCIEKSLGNIEVVGDFKAASITTPTLHSDAITTPSLTAEAATIDDLTVTNPVEDLTVENLTVTDTASINHATIVTEEDIHSEADYIELRVNNPLPTPSTGSGFKVKNYDGNNNDLELTTDSSGTFRIGDGNLSMQPLATREEATVLNNNDILVWDSTANQLKHITRPTVNGTALKAIITNGVVTGYDWGSSGGNGVAFIGTRAAYNTAKLIPEGQDGYIPAGALVIITDEDELLIGDEQ
jgi:hypothetical protein